MAITVTLNTGLTPLQNVVALVNEANPSLNLVDTEVSAGAPVAGDVVGADEITRNTTLTLTALAETRFIENSTVSITYVRPSPTAPSGTVNVSTANDTATQVKEQVLTALGVDPAFINEFAFTGDTLVDADVATQDPYNVTVTANASSLLFVGAQNAIVQYPLADLGDEVQTTEMNGFA